MATEKIYEAWQRKGISRRDFLKAGAIITAALGLSASEVDKVMALLQERHRVPVIWLEFQDCAGCTESIARSQNPTLSSLVLNTLTIEYHETLMAAAGFQAEDNRRRIMQDYRGEYVLVVEGSVPTADDGVYCTIGGHSAEDLLKETAEGAAAIIAVGNCAAYGGIPKAKPNPTGAKGIDEILTDKTVVNIPGCPAIPEAMSNTITHFVVFGELPELDEIGRPLAYYRNTVHDRCLKRPFYEAGKFAESFDDEGYRAGWCLFKLGCKGPTTYNACASLKWNEGTSFPIQAGHPCIGCSQPNFWDQGGFYTAQSAPLMEPSLPMALIAAGVGAAAGAGVTVANRMGKKKDAEPASQEEEKASE
ncbi:MAG: hydrogenase small subunit [Chloroflexi bacterium]|nr:hydrogenase small subunit [Chloroflexota bacterium]